MADKKVWGFNQDGFNRVVEATKRVFRTPTTGARMRRQSPIIGGSGGGCDSQNAIWFISILGSPTGGTFTLDVIVNSTLETITFNWNDSASAFATTLATHSEIATSDITVSGALPNATIMVEFTATLANTDILPPRPDYGSLTGGAGRGVISMLIQKGHA